MKNIFKTSIQIFSLLMTLVTVVTLSGCEDYPDAYKTTSGVPEVYYARIPDALSSDSLITHAYMGTTIALVGKNLTSVKELWFNDKKADLNTSLITSEALIVIVPEKIPDNVTSKIYLINAVGDTVKFDFGVDVPNPLLSSMDCEYVADGDVATINGNYFLPVDGSEVPEVTFTPNIKATEIVSFTLNQIKVKVPQGASAGPVSVTSRYGTTRSTSFYFRDNRGIILDWDNTNASGGWRAGNLASDGGISGNYVKFSGSLDDSEGAGSSWNEDGFSFNLWGVANGRAQGDLFSTDPSTSVLKFEINVTKAWSCCALQMIFTPWATTGTNSYIADGVTPRGLWRPWESTGTFITDGWITVTVPLSDFKYTQTGSEIKAASAGNFGGLTFFVYHGGIKGDACTPEMHIDNIRVVPAN